MRIRFLGVQISLIWVVFAVKTGTLLWQPVKRWDITTERLSRQQFVAETCLIPIMITKGPQLISKTNILLQIPACGGCVPT